MSKIETYTIETGLGEYRGNSLWFLTEQELKEFNSIGYSGKTLSGLKISREEYLNSLNKGTFNVSLIKADSGNFVERFQITRAYRDILHPEEPIHTLLESLLNTISSGDRQTAILQCGDLFEKLKNNEPLPKIESYTHVDEDNAVNFWSYSIHEN